MFRALAQGANRARTGRPLRLRQEKIAARKLRKDVVQAMRSKEDEWRAFGLLDALQEIYIQFKGDFQAYCDDMMKDGVWGGDSELLVAWSVLGRPIRVYELQNNTLREMNHYGQQLERDGRAAIHLLWSAGGHYDLLMLK